MERSTDILEGCSNLRASEQGYRMVKQIKRIALHVGCGNGESFQKTAKLNSVGQVAFEWEKLSAHLGVVNSPAGKVGHLDLELRDSSLAGLAMSKPVRVSVHMSELPEAMTAFSMVKDWWTRPSFCADYGEIPKRTQVLLLQYSNRYACLIPMVGTVFKSLLMPGGPDWFTLVMTSGLNGLSEIHEPLFLCSEGQTILEAIEKAFAFLASEKNIPLREDRRYPEVFEYLGWCSWDAFYRDLDEKGVRAKAEEFRDKNVPVRWFLLDDGWLSTQNDMLWDFIPDSQKFPGGFASLVQELRQSNDIHWFGAWHALAGYWSGVHPEGPLARSQAEHLQAGRDGNLLPKANKESAFGFYDDWHRLLQREGIDFVKVDVQGDIVNLYRGRNSVCRAAAALQTAVDAGSACMDNTVVNCMGMNLENMLSRPVTAVSRNSDDFFPDRSDSFKEHLLQNAYNALYHGQLYWLDWDMFWTSHPDALRHAVLRAVSGGPIYVSDALEKTDGDVLNMLAYGDGRILRLKRPAIPTADCVFRDPFKEGILKLHNVGHHGASDAGILAAFNISDSTQSDSFAPADIKDLTQADRYFVYDWVQKTVQIVKSNGSVPLELEPEEWRLFWILPWENEGTILGLTEKLVGFTALESFTQTQSGMTGALHEGGAVAVVSSSPLTRAFCNGAEVHLDARPDMSKPDEPIVSNIVIPDNSRPAILELKW